MLADPQTITIDGSAITFRRVPSAGTTGVFKNSDGSLTLEIFQNNTKTGERFNARLTRVVVGPDQVNPAINRTYKSAQTAGSSGPINGIGITDVVAEKDAVGFAAWYTAAIRASLRAGEA
jgi:hypothetical protein